MAAKFGDRLILVLPNDINNQQEGFGLIQRKKKIKWCLCLEFPKRQNSHQTNISILLIGLSLKLCFKKIYMCLCVYFRI